MERETEPNKDLYKFDVIMEIARGDELVRHLVFLTGTYRYIPNNCVEIRTTRGEVIEFRNEQIQRKLNLTQSKSV